MQPPDDTYLYTMCALVDRMRIYCIIVMLHVMLYDSNRNQRENEAIGFLVLLSK